MPKGRTATQKTFLHPCGKIINIVIQHLPNKHFFLTSYSLQPQRNILSPPSVWPNRWFTKQSVYSVLDSFTCRNCTLGPGECAKPNSLSSAPSALMETLPSISFGAFGALTLTYPLVGGLGPKVNQSLSKDQATNPTPRDCTMLSHKYGCSVKNKEVAHFIKTQAANSRLFEKAFLYFCLYLSCLFTLSILLTFSPSFPKFVLIHISDGSISHPTEAIETV